MTQPRFSHQAPGALRQLTLLAPAILLGMLLGTLLLWDTMLRGEQEQQAYELDVLAHSLAARLDARLRERMNALARMAKRWQVADGTPRHAWEADARAYMDDLEGLLALQWLDPQATVQWVIPLAGNEKLIGTTPNRDPVRLGALADSRERKGAVLSAPIELIQGGMGVLMFHPLFGSGERFDGFLVSVSRLDALARGLDETRFGRAFALRHDGRLVYGSSAAADSSQEARTSAGLARLVSGDGRWEVEVSARAAERQLVSHSSLTLAGGLVGTLLVGVALWFWRAALLRAVDSGQLAQIVARTTNAVILTDALGRVEWVNDGFTRITGYGLDDVRGRKPGDVLQGSGTDPATVERMHASLLRGEGFRERILNYHRNGDPCWLDIEVQPIRDKGGITGFMAIESDITDRKRAEEALQETQNFLSTIIDSMPVMLFVKDATELRFVMFNRAGEELLGLGREDLLGKSDHDLFPKEQADFFVARDREVLAQGKRLEIAEEPIDTPHGTRLLHTVKVPVNDSHGRPAYLLGISTDITESKKVERLKSEFISTVSHELRTPLTSIRGSLGLVFGGVTGPLNEKALELLAIALKNSERLTDLINDILDIEKIDSGRMKFAFETQALASLMLQAVDANRAYASALDVSIELAPMPQSIEVSVDSGRFLQVMSNLLSNAAKFSPKGGTVEVAVGVMGRDVRISVTDHGPGIPEEFQARIFQRFSQADSSDTRSRGGTGLGLAITKSIVERMGGRIGFDTRAGDGTTFFVDLPLAA